MTPYIDIDLGLEKLDRSSLCFVAKSLDLIDFDVENIIMFRAILSDEPSIMILYRTKKGILYHHIYGEPQEKYNISCIVSEETAKKIKDEELWTNQKTNP
jgi:hypothetical protein